MISNAKRFIIIPQMGPKVGLWGISMGFYHIDRTIHRNDSSQLYLEAEKMPCTGANKSDSRIVLLFAA